MEPGPKWSHLGEGKDWFFFTLGDFPSFRVLALLLGCDEYDFFHMWSVAQATGFRDVVKL